MTLTPFLLSELIPTASLVAAYPCVDVTAAVRLASVADYSGTGKTLSAVGTSTDRPLGELNSLNGRPSVVHAGEKPLLYAPSVSVKEVWIMCKYDLAANFGSTYRGLVSGETAGDALTGDGSGTSTKFFDLSESLAYKSQVSYASGAFEAPFSKFEVVRTGNSVDLGFDGLQVGQQKDFDGVLHAGATARRWRGRWMGLFVFSSLLSANEARAMNLYYDLVYQQWRYAGTTLEFPEPNITGIRYHHYEEVPVDWDGVTDDYEYEDGGKDFNVRTSSPTQRWEIEFTPLTYAQLQIFKEFNRVARRDRTFSFTDKYGVTWSNVRIESYKQNHDAHKSWRNTANFTLAQYS